MKKSWKRVKDEDVENIWVCKNKDCKRQGEEVSVYPTFYEENGTLTCECGEDMAYSHTKVRA